jgi:hypothetical protein
VPVSVLDHSFTVLDRWLLEVLRDHGAMTASAFSEEADAQAAGSKHGVQLSPAQVQGWLDSARRRGLLEYYTVDLPGAAIQPPVWGLSALGRARLAEATASTHFVPASVGKIVLPLLENAGKGLLGFVAVYLAARATRIIHHGVSVGFAQAAIAVLVAIGLVAFLVIRYTDNRDALKRALATIKSTPESSAPAPLVNPQDNPPTPPGRPTGGN